MDASGVDPAQQRLSNKRSYSEMQSQHRTASESPFFDDHYRNDNDPAQRPRPSHSTLASFSRRYPGDGFDFRRPSMSAEGGAAGPRRIPGDAAHTIIDLTGDDDINEVQAHDVPPDARAFTPTEGQETARGSRLPRFGRDIIDLGSDDEEEQDEAPNADAELRHTRPTPPRHSNHLTFASETHPSHHDYLGDRRAHPRLSYLRRHVEREAGIPTPPDMDFDDLEIVSTRPISRPRTRQASPNLRPGSPDHRVFNQVRSVTPFPNQIDLTEDDDDVVHVESRTREGVNLQRPAATGASGVRSVMNTAGDAVAYFHERMGDLRALRNFLPPRAREFAGAVPQQRREGPPADLLEYARQRLPVALDYGLASFDLYGNGVARAKTPPYQAPESPTKGFTRSPEENEELVCPNCGDELAMGDDEIKQQVWVIKGCGHAYCGACASTRATKPSKSKSTKGKSRAYDTSTIPLKTCVVEGCNKPAHAKQMVRIYLD